jgi:hypothetical protein
MDPASLYREETFTDRRLGVVRVMANLLRVLPRNLIRGPLRSQRTHSIIITYMCSFHCTTHGTENYFADPRARHIAALRREIVDHPFLGTV